MKKMLALLLTFSIVQYGLIFGQIFWGGYILRLSPR